MRRPVETRLPDDVLGRIQEGAREGCLYRMACRVERAISSAEDIVGRSAALDHVGLSLRFNTACLDLLYWTIATSFRLHPDDWRQFTFESAPAAFERHLEGLWLGFFGRASERLVTKPAAIRAFARVAVASDSAAGDEALRCLLEESIGVLHELGAPSPWNDDKWPR